MGGALHALGNGRKARPETGEVDQAGHESGDLDVRALDKGCDELLDRGQERLPDLVGRGGRWCGRQVLVERRFTPDDLCGLLCKVRDHILGDGLLDEVVQRRTVLPGQVC